MIAFCRTILDAIHHTYGDDYILEPDLDQDIRDIYTETHFALANVLLYRLDGDRGRLDTARTHFQLFGKLNTETPFNNFAVNLALLLLGGEDPELEALLRALSRRQTLDRAKVFGTRCGNNMYFMQAADDLVIRPLALGQETDAGALLEELDRFRNSDGLYFDEPRYDERTRRCPLTYCLKFLFLVGLCHALQPDERTRKVFLQGVDAVRPLFTSQGDLSYFGRSDNTVFATGLAVFVHRMAAHLDADHAPYHARMGALQEERLERTPRMEGGWLSIHRVGPSRVWPRDSYAYPTEYSSAAVCYVLLSRLLAKEATAGDRSVEQEGAAAEAGLVLLRNGGYEAIFRTRSQPDVLDRRYLGPTVLRLAHGDRTLVGTVPMLCSLDHAVRAKATTRAGKLLGRFLHGYRHGTEPLNAHLAGFIPVLLRGPHILLPARRLALEKEGSCVTARYAMERRLLRGARVAWHLARSLVLKNLLPGYREEPLTVREESPVELERKITLGPEGLILEDRIEGPLKGLRLVLGVRRFADANAVVQGLSVLTSHNAWGSDGTSTLDLHGMPCRKDIAEYAVTLSGQPGRAGPG